MAEGSEAQRDKVCELYPVFKEETEVEEEEEEEEEEETMKGESSAVDLFSPEDAEVYHPELDVDINELNKDASEVDLRSVDLQSAFEPELQLNSVEPQQVLAADGAGLLPVSSETKPLQPSLPLPQVLSVHCVTLIQMLADVEAKVRFPLPQLTARDGDLYYRGLKNKLKT